MLPDIRLCSRISLVILQTTPDRAQHAWLNTYRWRGEHQQAVRSLAQ
jgi:hypothetical protein